MKKIVSIVNMVSLILACLIFLYVVIQVLLPLFGGLIIGGGFNPPIGKDKMEKIFYEDREDLFVVRDFLNNLDSESATIWDLTEKGYVVIEGEDIKIEDDIVINAVESLKKKRYSVISKDENTVCFQRWANLDYGRGIAYSTDGDKPTGIEYLIDLEKLSENNWYYWEAE